MTAIVPVEKLHFEFGHVDVRRAFGLAPLALQAQVVRVEQALAGELLRIERSGQDHSQGVGPPARAVFFVARDHERRAHRAGLQFAAYSRAVAQLDRAGKSAVAREVERRRHLDGLVRLSVAQVFHRARAVDDFAGVHAIPWIEGGFDLLEGLVDSRAEQAFVQVAARQAVAVFAAHGAAKLDRQVAHFSRNGLQVVDVDAGAQIEHRPDVQTAHRRVTVERTLGVVPGHDLAKPLDERGQVLGGNGGVLDKGHRFARAGLSEQQRQRSFAAGPHVVA